MDQMSIYTNITKVLALLILFNIISIVNAVTVRSQNNIQISASPSEESEREYWLRSVIFNFSTYHSSGVYHDLGRNVESYRMPAGRCPIFGKVLLLMDNFNFNTTSIPEGFSVENFKEYLKTGKLLGGENANGLVLPVEQLNKLNSNYTTLKPVKIESLDDCINYARSLSQSINLNNCQDNNTCLNHPFIYNLFTYECYVLFPLWQEKKLVPDKAESLYRPYKSMYTNFFVFGSSSIHTNWAHICPRATYKGAAFGLWSNNKCNKIGEVKENMSFNDCVKLLFALSPSDGYELSQGKDLYESSNISQGKGINYANWYNNTCEIIKEQPDCFYHSRYNYALMSSTMNTLELYNILPCTTFTEGWQVDVNCESGLEMFQCKNRTWLNDKNIPLDDCSKKLFELFKSSKEQLRIEENKVIVPKLLQQDIAPRPVSKEIKSGPVSKDIKSGPISKEIKSGPISKEIKSGGVKSWKNGAIISSVFFLIICFAL